MSEMIEKVAAAIMKDAAVGELLWSAAGEERQDRFRRAAIAALKAMGDRSDIIANDEKGAEEVMNSINDLLDLSSAVERFLWSLKSGETGMAVQFSAALDRVHKALDDEGPVLS